MMESSQSAALRTLQKKRTTNFREDETRLLIQLWGSPQIQNKLYLTHRKAPVMRLLAANMQHRGFYRTPDEIKTRLRNLKCLYHRIKRSMQTGVGIGTVDPDWPHYKAMDEILTRKNRPQNIYKNNVFDGPNCEDIKQEIIDEIDINDEMESYTTNSGNGSDGDAEFEDEPHQMPPLTPAPTKTPEPLVPQPQQQIVKIAPKPLSSLQQQQAPKKVVHVPVSAAAHQMSRQAGGGVATPAGTAPQTTLPFPLLILNGMPTGAAAAAHAAAQHKKDGGGGGCDGSGAGLFNQDMTNLMRDLVDIQKENLEVEKQRLELDRQSLEFHRMIGSQLLTLVPMFGNILHRLPLPQDEGEEEEEESKKKEELPRKNGCKKRPCPDDGSDMKILRNVLEEGIKKYMLEEIKCEKSDGEEEDNENDL